MEKNVKLKLIDIEFSKSRFKTYFGNIGEMIAEQVLLKEGYAVCKWRPYVAGEILSESKVSHSLRRCLNCLYPLKPDEDVMIGGKIVHLKYRRESDHEVIIKELQDFFGSKLSDFKNYTDSLGLFNEAGTVIYTPDLVAKKR